MPDAGDGDFARIPDELLLHILKFVTTNGGAATTALSKRWRPLWKSSGAINLEARILEDDEQRMMEAGVFFDRRDKFVADAHKALDGFTAAPVPVTMLTFRVEGQAATIVRDFLNRDATLHGRPQVLAGVLAHPAASALEELRITAVDNIRGEPMIFEKINGEAEWSTFGTRMYSINTHSLPSATLRVLDLTNSGQLTLGLQPPAFPHLWKLRLCRCELLIPDLQRFVDTAPLLAFIHLQSVLLEDDRIQPNLEEDMPLVRSLSCQAATTLVIFKCCLREEGTLQIFAPMLQYFVYDGILRSILLSPTPQNLLRADVNLLDYRGKQNRDAAAVRQRFCELLQGFIHVKQIKLNIRLRKGFNVTSHAVLLPVLHSIKCIELGLVYSPTNRKAAMLIANILTCCPKLRDLRLNLTSLEEDSFKGPEYSQLFLERKFEADRRCSERLQTLTAVSPRKDFQESVHRAKRLKTQLAVADAEHHYFDDVPELPELGDRRFDCLHKSLKRVALQFRQSGKSCFGHKLVKFFAKNAMVLEEMSVDGGNAKLGDHVNLKIKDWIEAWPEERKFKILPLKRRN